MEAAAFVAGSVLGGVIVYLLLRFVAARFASPKWAALLAGGATVGCAMAAQDAALGVFVAGVAMLVRDLAKQPAKA